VINLVNKIFELARHKELPFVFIRPKSIKEPDIYSGDFDILIKPECLNLFLVLVHQQCAITGTNFSINRTKKEKTNLILFSSDSENKVEYDLWTELDVKDSSLAKSTHISWDTLATSKNIVQHGTSYELEHNFSALFYLSHLYSKNKDLNNQEVQSRLNYFRELEGVEDSTQKLLHNVDTKSLLQANQTLKSQNLFSHSSLDRVHRIYHRFQTDISRKSGLLTVVGPDGVGKTTVIEQLEKKYKAKYFRFKKLFRKAISYKLLLAISKKALEKQEGKKIAKNQFDDLQCAKLFWISIPSGYWLALKARFGKKKIIDRFYLDLLIKGSRFLDKEVQLIPQATRWINIAPTPTCIIQLDAPSDVILARKEELSSHAIDKFRHLYFDVSLTSKAPYYVYINTQNSIESTFQFLNKLELKF